MNKIFKIIGILVAVVVIGLLIAQISKKPGELRIGVIAPLTGDAAIYGNPLKKGLDLAKDEINSKGGINGKNISLIYEDSYANSNAAVSAFNKLISVNRVSIIIGDMFSQSTLAIAPLAQKNKIVLLSPTASSEKVPETGDYVFSIYPNDSYDGEFIAKFVFNTLHILKAAVICVQADAMLTAKNAFVKTYNELGGNVLAEESYPSKTDDFRTILIKAKFSNPDLIFIPGYLEEIVKILKQAKELGIKSQFITISTAYDEKLFSLATNTAQSLMLSAPFYEENSSSASQEIFAFQELYKKKYNEIPNVWAAYGYDALKIICKAYKDAIKNKSSLNIELSMIKSYPGVTGETTFLKNRKVDKRLRILIVNNNKFIEYK